MTNENPPTCEATERLLVQLSTVCSRISTQDQIVWVIFSVFAAAHSVLLDALFSSGRFTLAGRGALVVSLTGVVFAYSWLHAQVRALGHLLRLEKVGRRIEEELGIDPKFRVLTSEVDPEEPEAPAKLELWPLRFEAELLRRTPPVRSLMLWLPLWTCLLWIFIFGWKIGRW